MADGLTRKQTWILSISAGLAVFLAPFVVLGVRYLMYSDVFVDRRVDLPWASEANLRDLLQRTQDELVYVEGGRFTMGVVEKYYHLHPVELTSYHISAYETTYAEQDLWAAFTDHRPILHRYAHSDRRTANRPAGTRTWYEAHDYCTWLGELTGLDFDLPTEAQWEYAARSRGRDVLYATANGHWKNRNMGEPPDWREGMMFSRRNVGPDQEKPRLPLPVGSLPPNPLGLYDMSGNAQEWVKDWYSEDYYRHSPVQDPQGPDRGKAKVLRGGSYAGGRRFNTTYSRVARHPLSGKKLEDTNLSAPQKDSAGYSAHGFRCALNLDRPLKEGELVRRAEQRGHLSD